MNEKTRNALQAELHNNDCEIAGDDCKISEIEEGALFFASNRSSLGILTRAYDVNNDVICGREYPIMHNTFYFNINDVVTPIRKKI